MTIRKKLCVYFNPLKEDFSIAAAAAAALLLPFAHDTNTHTLAAAKEVGGVWGAQ